MRKIKNKKTFWILLTSIALLIGLLLSVVVFNVVESKKNIHLEISFVQPHQAVVFWKTDHETTGYVKYGTKKNNRDTQVFQTSSTPGEIHAVVLDDIPLEGVYISLHNESDSPFLWKKPIFISFDPTTIE